MAASTTYVCAPATSARSVRAEWQEQANGPCGGVCYSSDAAMMEGAALLQTRKLARCWLLSPKSPSFSPRRFLLRCGARGIHFLSVAARCDAIGFGGGMPPKTRFLAVGYTAHSRAAISLERDAGGWNIFLGSGQRSAARERASRTALWTLEIRSISGR